MADMRNMLNASTQILSGYLAAEEKKKEKDKVESQRKKMEEMMNSGDYTYGMNANGTMSIRAVTTEEKVKAMAFVKYQQGDRSPEILKALGMYVTPPAQAAASRIPQKVEGYKDLAAKSGWGLNINQSLTPERQLDVSRQLYAAKKSESGQKTTTLTPSQALSIISDPFKAQQLKKQYPDWYAEVERIARQALGQKETPQATPLPEGNVMDTNW